MAVPVLATKLFIPAPRANAVRRPRLVGLLESGLRAGRKLTLISAPAGFGKTSLLSEWIAESQRLEPHTRVGWVSLGLSDNDPVTFLAYLSAALRNADPSIGSAGSEPAPSIEATLTSLVNDVARSHDKIVLVLDDFQSIEDLSIRDGIAFLLDHQPQNLHLVVASRSDPLLPLARLRASGDLTELRARDLRFTTEEAAAFLDRAMGLSLSPDDIAALEMRTEGWIAGLQLAALSVRGRADASGFITAFAGSNRFIVDYLIEEVLARQPDHVRNFLYQTAILERFNGPLADAVTRAHGGSEMLKSLERANLFIVPLDDQREWYRYHQLFADVLRARLLADGREDIAGLHRRASEWYESNGFAEDSIAHALLASDFPRAARVIETIIPSVRKSRQDATLLGWLALLPPEIIERRPVLSVFSAWSSLTRGDVSAVEPQLKRAEELISNQERDERPAHDSAPGEELETLPVTIALYRAALALALGDMVGLREHAQHALNLTSSNDYLGRGAAAGLLGLAAWAGGDLESGVRAFKEASTSLRLAGNLTDALSTTMVVADMLLPLGRLREADDAFEDALREATDSGSASQTIADLHAAFSELFRERNQLGAATEHLLTSDAVSAGSFSHEHRYRWFVSMARIREAEGDLDAAVDLLTEAERHYRRGFFPEVRPIGGMKARIAIRQGRLRDAQAWIDEQGLTSTDELDYLREFGHVTVARFLIAGHAVEHRDGALEDAISLLDRLLEAATAGGRVGTASEILVLQALALQALDQTKAAMIPLERALAQSEPEDHIRLFLDEGAPMAVLLRAAAGAGIRPAYVRRLNQAFRETDGDEFTRKSLPEPLSDRELQVLRLLATELTGPEIASELYVSLNTMRTHTKHIFIKLDVNTRPAAIRRAEALGLI